MDGFRAWLASGTDGSFFAGTDVGVVTGWFQLEGNDLVIVLRDRDLVCPLADFRLSRTR